MEEHYMNQKDCTAVIGTTRKHWATDAGRELAETLKKQLGEQNPDFIVLFSTIHYLKKGGFDQLLRGIYDVFTDQVTLVGGTVRGFVNNDGCFARGATALAVSSDEMNYAISKGTNTKRNPQKAAKQCAFQIEKNLRKTSIKTVFYLILYLEQKSQIFHQLEPKKSSNLEQHQKHYPKSLLFPKKPFRWVQQEMKNSLKNW